ncbi:MAG: hypothetical protein CL933_10690 [Deltaproteobacteria bacterium]|nr:hypothetical protein [Deltaproteobacteria bacterium]
MVIVAWMKIRFGDYQLDEERYLLECSGERVELRPKVFDLLVELLRHRTRVVRRDELVERLWDSTSVGAGSLSGLVNELRHALGEDGRSASSIRTVHARGYQFVAPVEGGDPCGRTHCDRATPGFGKSRASTIIERVAEQGTCGVVIEVGESGGSCGDRGERPDDREAESARGEGELSELLILAEQTGFEIHRFFAPDESMASPSRFARQVIDSMIASRGRATVSRALPLPARAWLEESACEPIAGGRAGRPGGPADPVGSLLSLLSVASRRCPVVILIEDVGRAGARFAWDLVAMVQRLEREPVLWVGTVKALALGGAWLRVLESEGAFESWRAAPARAALDRSLRRLGLDPLPAFVMAAIEAHVRGDPAALDAIGEWMSEFDRDRDQPRRRASDSSHDEVVIAPASDPVRGAMRSVVAPQRATRLRSVDP